MNVQLTIDLLEGTNQTIKALDACEKVLCAMFVPYPLLPDPTIDKRRVIRMLAAAYGLEVSNAPSA